MSAPCPNPRCKEGKVLADYAAGAPVYVDCAFCESSPAEEWTVGEEHHLFATIDGVERRIATFRAFTYPPSEQERAERNKRAVLGASAPKLRALLKRLRENVFWTSENDLSLDEFNALLSQVDAELAKTEAAR